MGKTKGMNGVVMLPLIVLTKSSKLLKLVKVFKSLKVIKILVTFVSMSVSVFVYSFAQGWPFALGFVILLFIHEMGHVWALKRKGLPASAPVFIPMLGAVIFAPEMKDPETEAYVGYGGPLIGSIGALACFALWAVMPSHPTLLLLLSYTGIFLNLFNLIPIRPLDGGRITQIVGGGFKYVGLAMVLALIYAMGEPSLLLILIIVLQDLPVKKNLLVTGGVICQVLMTVLMLQGYGQQSQGWDIADFVLATIINGLMYLSYKQEKSEEKAKQVLAKLAAWRLENGVEDTEPEAVAPEPEVVYVPTRRQKAKWLLLYFAMVAALIGILVYQQTLLPDKAKGKTVPEGTSVASVA